MTNDDSVLREVDRAVAEDRQWEVLRQNGPVLIAGALVIVAAVGGWQVWSAQKGARASKTSIEFAAASESLRDNAEDGRAALEEIAAEGPGGYAALADMRLAGSLATNNDREGALAAYRKIYKDGGAPKRLKELARLRAAQLSLADGRDAVLSDLGSMTESDSPFGPYARELAAVAALQAKDYAAAASMFETAAADPETPEPIRLRAEELAALAQSGKAGVNLTGEARVDDLMKALEGAGGSAPAPEPSTAPDETPDAANAEEPTESAPDGDGATQDQ